MAEAYTWTAIFEDGVILTETEAGTFARVMEQKVRPLVVEIVPLEAGFPPIVCQVPEDARPIFFRRRMFDLDPNTGVETNHRTYTAIGYQRTKHFEAGDRLTPLDVNEKHITWVCPDGSVLVGGEPN